MGETDQASLRAGAVGGKRAILRTEVQKLPGFVQELEDRFKLQMDAIHKRT